MNIVGECENTYPVPTYRAQTWATTQKQLNKIYITQLAMECSVTGKKLKDRVYSSKIRDLMGIKNLKYVVKKLKPVYEGYIKWNNEDRWEKKYPSEHHTRTKRKIEDLKEGGKKKS